VAAVWVPSGPPTRSGRPSRAPGRGRAGRAHACVANGVRRTAGRCCRPSRPARTPFA
jgi:hypothetical protein